MLDRILQSGEGVRRPAWGMFAALAFAVVLPACDSLLDVELPDTVTGDALESPATAQVQLNGIIGQVECGLSGFHYNAAGYEDVVQRVAGTYDPYSEFDVDPPEGSCDTAEDDFNWFDPLQTARASGYALTDRILNQWTVESVENRDEILAQTSLYTAIALEVSGTFFCETAIDAGPLVTADETLALAQAWADSAIKYAGSDNFELPEGITGPDDGAGILDFAYAIRGRIQWARGPDHYAGALSDFNNVSDDFTAWITREAREDRRNKVHYHSNPGGGFVHDAIGSGTWDDPPQSDPGFFDPVYTGTGWPDPIPFTGYIGLGVLPDGRVTLDNLDGTPYPVTLDAVGAVEDTRVDTAMTRVASQQDILPVPVKDIPGVQYTSQNSDMPLVTWREINLMVAEMDEGQAIGLINELRDYHGLPNVSYGPTGDELENLILEERRRELFLEGRYWATKIQNTHKLWFPRDHGAYGSYQLDGGVRLAMPSTEYEVNENLSLADRGTGCPAAEAPIFAD